jgi:hypothetical protein
LFAGRYSYREGAWLTLRHLAAHVTRVQYATLRAAYEACGRAAVRADVPG